MKKKTETEKQFTEQKHTSKTETEKKEPISEHINALRKTIIICLVFIIAGMGICYGLFRRELMNLFTSPVQSLNVAMIYTGVSEGFMTEMKVSLLSGIILTSPFTGLFIWRFVSPAFFSNERRSILRYSAISVFLFIAGVLFCYYELVPLVLRFFLTSTVVNARAMYTIGDYIRFIVKMILPFGLAFEMPLIVYLLIVHRIVLVSEITKARKFVFLGCFILGAVLTPPDVISQIMISVPMYLLYESGILFARMSMRRRKDVERK